MLLCNIDSLFSDDFTNKVLKADKEGVPIFLDGTPFAHGLYEHVGYKTLGRIDLKLDEWVVGPSGEKIGWGTYTMWNMVRLPET